MPLRVFPQIPFLLADYIRSIGHYALSAKFRNGVRLMGMYLHGTIVTSILAAREAQDFSVINFPLFTADQEKSRARPLRYDPTQLKWNAKQISVMLQQGNVRVVNISVQSSPGFAMQAYDSWHLFGGIEKVFFRAQLKNHLQTAAEEYLSFLEELIRSNPNIVFVMCAGNEGLDLDQTIFHSSKIEAPNLIKVGAIDPNEHPTGYSNRSPRYVQVYALGDAYFGSENLPVWGTSYSAPAVSKAVGKLISRHPNLTAEQAVNQFLKEDTRSATGGGTRVLTSSCGQIF